MRTTLALVAVLACSTGVARADEDDQLYKCHAPPPSTKLSVSFKPETSLQDLAVWVTGFSCKNVIFSSDVAKRATRVTVISPTQMTPKQALALFVDAVEATGLVVTVKPDTIIIKLGANMPKGCPDVAATNSGGGELGGYPGALPPTAPPSVPPAVPPDLQAAMQKGIRKIDATHYEITEAVLDALLGNPMEGSKGARVTPAVLNSKPIGFRLYAIAPTSMWGRLGFQNGDTVHKINGFEIDSADKALEVYTKLRDAKNLDVELTRRGKPATISIKVTKK